MKKPQTLRHCKILFVDYFDTRMNPLKLLFQNSDLPIEPTFTNSTQNALEVLENYNTSEFVEVYVKKHKPVYPQTKSSTYILNSSFHSTEIQHHAESIICGLSKVIPQPFDNATFENKILSHFNSISIRSNSPPSEAKMLSS